MAKQSGAEQPEDVWLASGEESQWLLSNRKTPVYVCVSMMSFNIIGVFALMLFKQKCSKTERGRAQLKHG
jgi:hypothetical protein